MTTSRLDHVPCIHEPGMGLAVVHVALLDSFALLQRMADAHSVVFGRIDGRRGPSAALRRINPWQRAAGRSLPPELAVHNVLYGLLDRPAGRLAFWTTVY